MKYLPLLLSSLCGFGSLCAFGADFISLDEYRASLYQNPRGIGCNHCHGEAGERVHFADFIEEGQKHEVIIPSIKDLDYPSFFEKLRSKSKSIMPSYSLTDSEIMNLYLYLNKEDSYEK